MNNFISKNFLAVKLVLLLCALSFLTFPVLGQDRNEKARTLLVDLWKDEPVEIVTINSAQGVLKSGKQVIRDENWLNGLSVRIKNITDKNIVKFSYTLILYGDGKSGELPIGTLLSYDSTTSDETSILVPSNEIVIRLDEEQLANFQTILKSRQKTINTVLKAKLHLQEVCFDDNTCWVGGTILPSNTLNKNESSQESSQSHLDCSKIRPQIDFCGKIQTKITLTCCNCSNRSKYLYNLYILEQSSPGETTYFICSYQTVCSCPEPGSFTNQCFAEELNLCNSAVQPCNAF